MFLAAADPALQPSLLGRIASGDRRAVRACIEAYGGLVWSLARRHLANDADAEEAVQDAFMSLWKSAGRFDPTRAEEATFVAMIARRRIIDRARKRARVNEGHELPEVPVAPQLEQNEDARRAAAALEALPEDKRKVLWLSIHQGMSHGEIAEATGLPLGTVKSHFRRGLQAVRELLREPSGEEVTL